MNIIRFKFIFKSFLIIVLFIIIFSSNQNGQTNQIQQSDLQKAIIYLDVKAVENQLKQNVDVNKKDSFGNTPLYNVVTRKIHENGVLSAKAEKLKKQKEAKAQLEITKLLLKRNADVNLRGLDDKTPLILAVTLDESISTQVIQLLIKNKANLNLQDKEGFTALMEASRTNRSNILKILLQNGANKDIKNSSGETALSIAKKHKFTNVINLLK